MRRSSAHRILTLCIPLFLAWGGAARADRILGEKGRELLGPDGRTLVDKKHGYSIVLPASDWKVYLWEYEPFEGDGGFNLILAPPDGNVRVRVIEKIHPLPFTLEKFHKMFELDSDPRVKTLGNKIVEVAGMKCLEHETETQYGKRVLHLFSWICDRDPKDPRRKFTVETFPGLTTDEWPAEEKVLRELVRSFRVLD